MRLRSMILPAMVVLAVALLPALAQNAQQPNRNKKFIKIGNNYINMDSVITVEYYPDPEARGKLIATLYLTFGRSFTVDQQKSIEIVTETLESMKIR